LNNISRLYLVPSEEFSWLPFHTLEVDGTPIIDRCSINYLPAAAVLLFSQKKESIVRNIIGIGNPGKTDWDVEYELKDIRSFFDSARMVFEESSLLSYLDTVSYDLLHFAVEFDLDYRVPDNSVMVFADVKKLYGGERIPLGEALKIAPPMALVFSNISPIAGGFYRYAPLAFLANGTPTVISTMWQGDRKAKKYFGEMFYTSLKAGLPASQAYHDAIIALMKRSEFSSLHRWGLVYRFGR
jgi:CHAT domain-containing protein